MAELKVKYWKGWIKSESIESQGTKWTEQWHDSAKKAEEENCELVEFRIPKNKMGIMADSETVSDIEKMLQDRFGS